MRADAAVATSARTQTASLHPNRRAFAPPATLIDGNRRVVAMGHRPDNVLGPERRVPAEEHLGNGRLEGGFVQPTISGCR